MCPIRKVRVVTDDTYSLAVVRREVSAAIGRTPRADLQELERREVVVELALDPGGVPGSPADLCRVLSRACRRLDVLSAWDEEPADAPPPRPGAGEARVLWDGDIVTVPVALRAVLDGVPTAQWVPAERAWTLGVPFRAGSGRRAVAVSTRRGYGRRFPVSALRPAAVVPVPA